MANHKVDMAEVLAFEEETKQLVESLYDQMDDVKASIDQIKQMDSFQGQTAEDAKAYFEVMHRTLLTAFQGVFRQLEANITKHVQDFQEEIDADGHAIIEAGYIEDQKEAIEDRHDQFKQLTEKLESVMNGVSDITAAQAPSPSTIDEDEHDSVQVIKKLSNKLDGFTTSYRSDEEQMDHALEEIKRFMDRRVQVGATDANKNFATVLPKMSSHLVEAKENVAFNRMLLSQEERTRKNILGMKESLEVNGLKENVNMISGDKEGLFSGLGSNIANLSSTVTKGVGDYIADQGKQIKTNATSLFDTINPFDDVSAKAAINRQAEESIENQKNISNATKYMNAYGLNFISGATGAVNIKKANLLNERLYGPSYNDVDTRIADMLGQVTGSVLPGTVIAKGLRGTRLGANITLNSTSLQRIGQTAKEGTASGMIYSSAEGTMTEILHPEERDLSDHLTNLAFDTGGGLILDPALSELGTPLLKGLTNIKIANPISKTTYKLSPNHVRDILGQTYDKMIKRPISATSKKYNDLLININLNDYLAYSGVGSGSFLNNTLDDSIGINKFDIKNSSGSSTKGTGNASNKVNFGEQYTKVNGKKALKPNIEYKTKEGYHYKTDSEGRISNVEATLQLGKADRNNYAQRTVGREDRLPNDDGGHLIASIFKGSGEIDNLVPMNATLNRKEYKALETSWKKALESGKTVEVKIEPIYKGNSSRPSKFEVEYKINGKKYEVNLSNYNGGS